MYRNLILFTLLVSCLAFLSCKEFEKKNNQKESFQLKVLTWNIWGRLNQEPKYTINGITARERMIDIIMESGADIITMTETYGSASDIAKALNYHYYTPAEDANLAIFSRYTLVDFGKIKDLSPFSFITASAKLQDGKRVRIYNIWLTSGGRHIVEIKNKAISDEDFVSGDQNRNEHIQQLLNHPDFLVDLAKKDSIPLIVAGDFNCVSHLDYTEDTKEKGLNYSRILPIQTSLSMAGAGFEDSYRFVHPKITKETLGYTWTTVGLEYMYKSDQGFIPVETNAQPEYRNPFARIDYIYSTGKNIKPIRSKTIVNHPSNKLRSFPEFPSDHGAVLTVFSIE